MKKGAVVILLSGLASGLNKSWATYWGEVEVKKSVIEKLNFEINSQIRFKTGISQLHRYRTEVGPVVEFSKSRGGGVYFRNIQEKGEKGWEGGNSFDLYGTFIGQPSGIYIMDRNRFDWENFELWKYRNLLEIRKPFVIREEPGYYGYHPVIWRLIPSVEEELFFNLTKNEIDENRLSVGISFEIAELLDFRVAVLLHSERNGTIKEEWHNKGIIVTTLQFIFLGKE